MIEGWSPAHDTIWGRSANVRMWGPSGRVKVPGARSWDLPFLLLLLLLTLFPLLPFYNSFPYLMPYWSKYVYNVLYHHENIALLIFLWAHLQFLSPYRHRFFTRESYSMFLFYARISFTCIIIWDFIRCLLFIGGLALWWRTVQNVCISHFLYWSARGHLFVLILAFIFSFWF